MGEEETDDIEHGESETHHPGYLGSQDTFTLAILKVWVVFISKPLWILILKLPCKLYTSRLDYISLTYLMIECYHS